MAKYQLLLPKMGESVAEATIIKWTKNPGDNVAADEAVMEIATDKVDSDVPSPVAGKLIEQLYKENDVVQVGSVIAIIETADPEEIPAATEPAQTPAPQSGETTSVTKETPAVTEQYTEQPAPVTEEKALEQAEELPETTDLAGIPGLEQLSQKTTTPVNPTFKSESRFYSPLVRNIAAQEGIGIAELDSIPGTGSDGRLTKDDLLGYLQAKTSGTPIQSVAAVVQSPVEIAPQAVAEPAKTESTVVRDPEPVSQPTAAPVTPQPI